jgi:uncharacterized damage-inducible protein DinB
MSDLDSQRFPIGPFSPRPELTEEDRERLIEELSAFPGIFRTAVGGLSDEELETPYREGGWTLRQVVHHVPDSHLQGYVRFKLAMTESVPEIRTYQQAPWGETADARTAPVEYSIEILEALHKRWAFFLRSLSAEDFARTYRHPEMGELTLEKTLQLYVWHGKHHLAHLRLVAPSA